jgi:hypothetical protein
MSVSFQRNNTENVSATSSILASKESAQASQLQRMASLASTPVSQRLQQCPYRRNDKLGEMYLCNSNKMQDVRQADSDANTK